jgi:hypothetical protein
MSWLGWIHTAAAVGINLHAVAALVLSRGKPLPVVRRWARRSGWLVGGFLGLSGVVVALVVRGGASAMESADPSMRAAQLGRQISEVMNCAALVVLVSTLPFIGALWLWWKARRA